MVANKSGAKVQRIIGKHEGKVKFLFRAEVCIDFVLLCFAFVSLTSLAAWKWAYKMTLPLHHAEEVPIVIMIVNKKSLRHSLHHVEKVPSRNLL